MMFLNFVVHQNAAQGQGPEVQCSKAALRGPPLNGGSYFNVLCVGKMKFPKFSGDDVEGWIYRCQQFFEFDSTLEELGSSWPQSTWRGKHYKGTGLLCCN